MTVSFNVTEAERAHISQIVDRFIQIIPSRKRDRMTLLMDLRACHANGTPMDFERLVATGDFNLVHDVGGINKHMDRTTGRLTDHFLPRFHKRTQES